MKNGTRLPALLCCVLAAALALSAPLPARAEALEGTRLIGLLVTTRDIAPFTGGEGVLWAAKVPGSAGGSTEYAFWDAPSEISGGLRFFCFPGQDENGESGFISQADDGICKADFLFEDESSVKMDGTILYAPKKEEARFFCNPVLLAADGRAFAVPGDFLSVSAGTNPPGSSVALKVTDQRKHTEDGREITDVTEVSIAVEAVREPLRLALLQFNEAHELLMAQEYAPGTVPETIVPSAEAEYFLLETRERGADGANVTRREAFGRQDDWLNTLSCRKDGVCIWHYHEIVWPDKE